MHMLWMGGWIHHHSSSTKICLSWFYEDVKILMSQSAQLQLISWYIVWGPRPTWNDSMSTPNISKVLDNTHMLWMCVHHICPQDFIKMAKFSCHISWSRIHHHATSIKICSSQFLDWAKLLWQMISRCIGRSTQTHMEWFSHLLQSYTARCLRTFLCCGWVDESSIMPLPSLLVIIITD
jgi:hypothetical protein